MSRQGTPDPSPKPRVPAAPGAPARPVVPNAAVVRPAAAGVAGARRTDPSLETPPPINPVIVAAIWITAGILLFLLLQAFGVYLESIRQDVTKTFWDEARKGKFGFVGPDAQPPDHWYQFGIFASFSAALWALGLAIFASVRLCRSKGIPTAWPVGAAAAVIGFVMVMSGHSELWLFACVPPLALLAAPFILPGKSEPKPSLRSAWTSPFTAAAILFLGLLCAYGTTFVSGMSLDNKYIIQEYYMTAPPQVAPSPIQSWPFAKNLFLRDYWWPKGISGLFRPIATFSYWLNYIYRDNKLGTFDYHVVNLALHWLTATLLFLLARIATGRYLPALLAGLIFVTHPITTESVTNIIGRADILAACCIMAGLLCYVRASRCARTTPFAWSAGVCFVICGACVSWMIYRASSVAVGMPGLSTGEEIFFAADAILAGLVGLGLCIADAVIGSGGKALWLAGLTAITTLGVFSKESGVAIVPMVLAWIFVFETNFRRRPLIEDARKIGDSAGLAGLAVLPGIVVMLLARYFVYRTSTPPEEPFLDNPIRGQTFLTGRMTAIDVAGRLLAKLVWPVHLSADYSWNQIPLFWWTPGWHNTEAVLWLLFFIAVLAATVFLYFRSRPACFFILFYFIGYAPTANIVKVIGAIMAERFMYLPLIGFAGAAGIGIDWLARRLNEKASTAGVITTKPTPAATDPIYWLPYAATLVILSLFCWRTSLRNFDWKDDVALFESGVRESPNAFRVYQSLAFAYYSNLPFERPGEHLSQERIDAIKKTFETAEKAYPIVRDLPPDKNSSRLYLHLGMYYQRMANFVSTIDANGHLIDNDQSKYYLRQAVKYFSEGAVVDKKFNETNYSREIARGTPPEKIHDSGMAFIYDYMGPCLNRLGHTQEAVETLNYARRLGPFDPNPLSALFEVYANAGNLPLAAMYAFEMVQLHPEQKQVWPILRELMKHIAPNSNAFVGDKWNLADQAVAQLTYQAFLDMTWTMYNAKMYGEAKLLRRIATEQCKFPPGNFPSAEDIDRSLMIQDPDAFKPAK